MKISLLQKGEGYKHPTSILTVADAYAHRAERVTTAWLDDTPPDLVTLAASLTE